jgi:hypothetical protein
VSYEAIIERRIAKRTATRGEWRAYRRQLRRRAAGLPVYDLALLGPVLNADLRRSARAWLKRYGPLLSTAAKALAQHPAPPGRARGS